MILTPDEIEQLKTSYNEIIAAAKKQYADYQKNFTMIGITNNKTSFKQFCDIWAIEHGIESYHSTAHEKFCNAVNQDIQLKEYRDFVENHVMGFGERSFLWLWKLLVDEMPEHFNFMEVGVFKGQILALIELLAARVDKMVTRYGITPLTSIGGVWESDYENDIKRMHAQFNIQQDYKIIKHDSTTKEAINEAYSYLLADPFEDSRLHLLYVDGGHEYKTALSDLENYSPLVRPGGFIIIDDACNDYPIPFGMFPGIVEVTEATNDFMKGKEHLYQLIFSIVHIKVFKVL